MQSEQEIGHVVGGFVEVDHRPDPKPMFDDVDIMTGNRRVQERLQQFGLSFDSRALDKKVVFPSYDGKISSIKGKAEVETSHADSRIG